MEHGFEWDNGRNMLNAVRYREYQPCEALRGSAGALFTFCEPNDERASRAGIWELQFASGERVCAPTFADGHACIVFNFDHEYYPDGVWRSCSVDSSAVLVGPMTKPGPTVVPVRRESTGVYFQPGSALAGVPLAPLANRAVPLEDLWGGEARRLWERLRAAPDEGVRIALLENALVQRMMGSQPGESRVKVSEVASWINANDGRLPIQQVAEAAGFSRQHFARVFHAGVGVSPKVYSELARFQSALGYLGSGVGGDWAQLAFAAGYSDQSHMIAEFRRFSGMTPEALNRSRWFHPFIERSARRFSRRPCHRA